MAVILNRTPIMPIDTLLTLSASPPISFFTGVDSLRYPPQYQRRTADHTINRGYYGVSDFGAGTFTQIVSAFSTPSSLKMVKANQPLRSCLRTKVEQNGNAKSVSQDQTLSLTRSRPSDLEDQMNKLRLCNQKVCSLNSKDGKRRVVFADSKGLPLERIKVLDELDVLLQNENLNQITKDAKPDPDHPYTYIVDFEQPASSYLQFRERIEYECVKLENVMIKDNIKVIGTVKVKNICFEKSVTVRVSFDKWRTHQDFAATFVPQNVTASRYDTFEFEFDIPPNQGGKEFEFCINYLAPGVDGSFWDSNNGNNYRIVSQERRGLTQQQKLISYQHSLSGHLNLGEFSYWKMATDDTPYW